LPNNYNAQDTAMPGANLIPPPAAGGEDKSSDTNEFPRSDSKYFYFYFITNER